MASKRIEGPLQRWGFGTRGIRFAILVWSLTSVALLTVGMLLLAEGLSRESAGMQRRGDALSSLNAREAADLAEAARQLRSGKLDQAQHDSTAEQAKTRAISLEVRTNLQWRADLVAARRFKAPGVFLCGVSGVMLLMPLLAALALRWMGARLREDLHRKDYKWVTTRDAAWIFFRLRWRAYDLPPAHDLETVPGFGPNADSLVAFGKLRK